MAKKIDLSKSVYELTKAYPELIEIMAELGFTEITKKAVSLLSFLPLGKKSKDRKSTRLNSSHARSRMPSSA